MANNLRIMICDDEESICTLLRDILFRFGYDNAVTCHDGAAAIARAEVEPFDLFFLDIRMPGMDGVEALQQLQVIRPQAKFIMITGYAHDDLMEKSIASGAYACLAKPFSLLLLKKLLEEITSVPISV